MHGQEQLSELQEHGTERVRLLLKEQGVEIGSVKVMAAHLEALEPQDRLGVQIVAPSLEVWLHTDAATFIIDDQQGQLERPDYEDNEALLNELVERLSQALSDRG